ncbi:Equilibrative nucleoside transporter 1, partial [Ophiophagus hannah]
MTASEYFIDRLKDSHSNVSSLDSYANVNVTRKEVVSLKRLQSLDQPSGVKGDVCELLKQLCLILNPSIRAGKKDVPLSYLQSIFTNVMTLCAMLPLLIFTCLNSFIHQRIPQQIRIISSLAAIFLVFMVTAILVKVPMEPLTFFIVTMVKIVLINSFGAILQGSLFGLAGLLPTSYTAPIMSGQGLAGTFAAVALICAIATGSELKESAFGYFITACVVIMIAIGSYIMLPRLNKRENATSVTQAEMETKVDLIKKDVVNGVERNHSRNGDSLASGHRSSVLGIFKKPGKESRLLPFLVVIRLIFIPLFMLCNVQPRNYLPVIFAHDAWYLIFMPLFSISNGYLASLCMCFGPKKVLSHEAETAGAIMAFFLSLGLALGAILSFPLRCAI